jgi:hypothetical protein
MQDYDKKREIIQQRINQAGLESAGDEPGTLSLAVIDIAESSEKIIDIVNRIIGGSSDVADEMHELAYELKHIVYHTKDARFLRERAFVPE